MSKEKNLVTDLDYAYGVFDSIIEALDNVAAHPQLRFQLAVELIQKMPEVFDAFMAITQEEHRPIIKRLFLAVGGLAKACYQKKPKKP